MKSNLDAQAAAVDNQRGELDKLIRDAQDELCLLYTSGLRASSEVLDTLSV